MQKNLNGILQIPDMFLSNEVIKTFAKIFQLAIFGKYSIVIVFGFLIDFIVFFLLVELLDVSLMMSTAIGYFFGFCFVYFLHKRFTFKLTKDNHSSKRVFRYLLSSSSTLLFRLLTISALSQITFFSERTIIIFLIANGFSFGVNYVLSVLFVFSKKNNSV